MQTAEMKFLSECKDVKVCIECVTITEVRAVLMVEEPAIEYREKWYSEEECGCDGEVRNRQECLNQTLTTTTKKCTFTVSKNLIKTFF